MNQDLMTGAEEKAIAQTIGHVLHLEVTAGVPDHRSRLILPAWLPIHGCHQPATCAIENEVGRHQLYNAVDLEAQPFITEIAPADTTQGDGLLRGNFHQDMKRYGGPLRQLPDVQDLRAKK